MSKKKNQQHHMIKSDAWAMGIQVDSDTGMVAMAVLQGRDEKASKLTVEVVEME